MNINIENLTPEQMEAVKKQISEYEKANTPTESYEDVWNKLKPTYYLRYDGQPVMNYPGSNYPYEDHAAQVASDKECRQVRAFIMIINTAKVVNAMYSKDNALTSIVMNNKDNSVELMPRCSINYFQGNPIYFTSWDAANHALRILGEKTFQEYFGIFE